MNINACKSVEDLEKLYPFLSEVASFAIQEINCGGYDLTMDQILDRYVEWSDPAVFESVDRRELAYDPYFRSASNIDTDALLNLFVLKYIRDNTTTKPTFRELLTIIDVIDDYTDSEHIGDWYYLEFFDLKPIIAISLATIRAIR